MAGVSIKPGELQQSVPFGGYERGDNIRHRLLHLFLMPLPLIGFLGGVFQVTSLLAIVLTSLRKKTIVVPSNLITLLIIFSVCLIFQVVTNTHYSIQIDSLVTDVNKRTELTFGTYVSSGTVNFALLLRFLVAFVIYHLTRDLISKMPSKMLVAVIKNLLVFCVIFQLLLFISVEFLGWAQFLKIAIGQGGNIGPSNYLTSDEFGYRLSLGFYEPSHMSVLIGPLIAIQARLVQGPLYFLASCGLVLFFAFTSRSSAMIFSFVIIYLILDERRFLVSLGVGVVGTVFVVGAEFLSYVRGIDGYNLLRSLAERTHIPDIDRFHTLHWVFGVDFGQVYSFVPILSQTLTLGLLFSAALFASWRRDLRQIYSFFALFFVVPQPWTLIPWISLGLVHGVLSARREIAA